VLKIHPDSREESRTRLLNPGMPIPAEASAIHGITDEHVRNEPRFAAIARSLFAMLSGSDLAGYNSNNFDIPFLVEEFARCGIEFPEERTRLIDVCTIFKRKEERTLTAAMKFYCDKNHEDAHDAEADVRATREVFHAQLERYQDVGGMTVQQLHAYCNREGIVDYTRRLALNSDGEVVFNFGTHKGKPVTQQLDYARWMLSGDFPEGTKMILRKIIDRAGKE